MCTIGSIASKPIPEPNTKYGMAIKRLLFASYQAGGKGLAVLLVFKSSRSMEVGKEERGVGGGEGEQGRERGRERKRVRERERERERGD